MGRGHDFPIGHHGDGFPAVWATVLLLACLLAVGVALARDDAVRARLLALWALVREQSHVAAVLGLKRPDARAGADGRGRAVPARALAAPLDVRPPRPELAVIASFPLQLRDVLVRLDTLAAGLTIPAAEAAWPARAVAEHRLETVRAALVDLVETFAQIPPDLAVQPAAYTGTSPLHDALVTAGLLEEEIVRLRNEVYAGLAAKLRRQRMFLADKYRSSAPPSTLDLS